MNSTRRHTPGALARALASVSASASPLPASSSPAAPPASTKWWKPQFLSARGFVFCAVLIAFLYAIVTIAGLREYTSILSGTVGSVRFGWQISALLGFGYIFVYLAFVLLGPILLIAAVLLWSWQKLRRR